MSELDALPPDQRAALQLLLRQGQSYARLATLLGIEADAVRGRAHAALDALGPETSLSDTDRADVADYLLGQQSASRREATRGLLADSPAASAWASGLVDALRPLAGDALPEVPVAGAAAGPPAREEAAGYEEEREEEPAAFDEPAPERPSRRTRQDEGDERPSSRLGGALLLGGLGIVVAVLLIVLFKPGDDDEDKASTVSRTAPTQTSTTGNQRPIAQINLFSASGNSRQVGLAQVFRQGNRRPLVVAGQGLSPGAYALWLYNSRSDAELLGFVPERVGRTGRFATQGQLPNDAEKFDRLVVTREAVTRETRTPPERPGEIVLQGDLKLES